ncbi:hypothetical protein BH09MYX1_BH09MYX1_35500 [soil metagenome]
MSFLRGLLQSRSHLAFLVGLGGALASATWLDHAMGSEPKMAQTGVKLTSLGGPTGPALKQTGVPLTDQERAWAKTAWRYFENNYQPATGFVNSVDGYASATLWDLGSYMMGLIAAHELGIVDAGTFDARLDKLLASLESLSLVDGIAPNKAYDTISLAMVDYDRTPKPNGIGWSAIDVARLAVPLTLVVWKYPTRTDRVRAIVDRFHLDQLVAGGQLIGSRRTPAGALERTQEGRFGYEQYAAKSFFLFGQDVGIAIRYDVDVARKKVSGQEILYDARLPRDNDGTHNAVLSEPYVLEGVEHGLDATTLPLARGVFLAQKNRWSQTGILTAASEDNLDQAPYFVYGSVLNDDKPWAAFSPDGKDASAFRSASLKAGFGWGYLFDDPYAAELVGKLGPQSNPDKGFYSGLYESNGKPNFAMTANTNGIVLEILLYRAKGPILRNARKVTP